jgi:hypothetical protein
MDFDFDAAESYVPACSQTIHKPNAVIAKLTQDQQRLVGITRSEERRRD